jgi:hypothetical protein
VSAIFAADEEAAWDSTRWTKYDPQGRRRDDHREEPAPIDGVQDAEDVGLAHAELAVAPDLDVMGGQRGAQAVDELAVLGANSRRTRRARMSAGLWYRSIRVLSRRAGRHVSRQCARARSKVAGHDNDAVQVDSWKLAGEALLRLRTAVFLRHAVGASDSAR